MGIGFDFLNSKVNTDILRFLADNSGKSDNEKDINLVKRIISGTGHSRKGVHDALLELRAGNLITYSQIGKSKVYEINNDSRVIKQFKVLKTVIELNPLIEKLEENTKKIILYGSASRGEDRPDSDIDLTILDNDLDRDEIKDEISKFKSKKKINAVLFTPTRFIELKMKDMVYYLEVDRGIVLWEEQSD
jgi:predicted nucleotidyltransferase